MRRTPTAPPRPPWLRPEPVRNAPARSVNKDTPARRAAELLRDGQPLIVTDLYHTGAEILGQLDKLMPRPPASAPFDERQAARRTHREATLRLLAPIAGHRLALTGARPIGFLAELYPDLDRFALPFAQAQELHGAWSRYKAGVHLAVVGHRIHPFYGTYVPNRTSHLELFATWLSQHGGDRRRAVDVGTGCGVMARMLSRAGFERVLATDINPNAVESVRRDLERTPTPTAVSPQHGDLFGSSRRKVDLIAFNPPWTHGPVESPLDSALYFDDDLFERFFDAALARLNPDGRIALVFSSMLQLVQPDVPHPIEAELERGRLRLVSKLHRKVRPEPGSGRRTKERVEIWELAHA